MISRSPAPGNVNRILLRFSPTYVPAVIILITGATLMTMGAFLASPTFLTAQEFKTPMFLDILFSAEAMVLGVFAVYFSIPFVLAGLITLLLWAIFRRRIAEWQSKPPRAPKKFAAAREHLNHHEICLLRGNTNLTSSIVFASLCVGKFAIVVTFLLSQSFIATGMSAAAMLVMMGCAVWFGLKRHRKIWYKALQRAEEATDSNCSPRT